MLKQILAEHRNLGEKIWQSKNLLRNTWRIYKMLMRV
jgi:hypothetical protein